MKQHTIKVRCKDCRQKGELLTDLVFKSGVPTEYLKRVEKHGVLCENCFNIFGNRREALLNKENYMDSS